MDLGRQTGVVAKAMNTYDPGANWHKAEDETARAQETK
jgi:hypothetical protein